MGKFSVTTKIDKEVMPDAVSISFRLHTFCKDKADIVKTHVLQLNNIKDVVLNIFPTAVVKFDTIQVYKKTDDTVITNTKHKVLIGTSETVTQTKREEVGYDAYNTSNISIEDISDISSITRVVDMLLKCEEIEVMSVKGYVKDIQDICLKLRSEVGKKAKDQATTVITPMGYKITGIDNIQYNMPDTDARYLRSAACVDQFSYQEQADDTGIELYAEGLVRDALNTPSTFSDRITATFIVE